MPRHSDRSMLLVLSAEESRRLCAFMDPAAMAPTRQLGAKPWRPSLRRLVWLGGLLAILAMFGCLWPERLLILAQSVGHEPAP